MSSALLIPALSMDNTVEVSRLRHQLALGVQCVDVLTQAPLGSGTGRGVALDLTSIGTRPWVQRLEAHSQGRHALRLAGRYSKLLLRAMALGDPLGHEINVYGQREAGSSRASTASATSSAKGYSMGTDPRVVVPRRVSLTPVISGGLPTAGLINARTVWLYPGAAYPLPAKATGLRGRIRRDLGAGEIKAAPWARVVITRAGAGGPDFAAETKLAWAHGDDRGEFLAVLGKDAVTGGAALPAQLNLHVWVFLPPLVTVWDATHPLASLPLEVGGTDSLNDVLRGRALPASYVPQSVRALSVKLGEVRSMNEADLLF
jgi:hypothetical protein